MLGWENQVGVHGLKVNKRHKVNIQSLKALNNIYIALVKDEILILKVFLIFNAIYINLYGRSVTEI
jgi:hypothetical protein